MCQFVRHNRVCLSFSTEGRVWCCGPLQRPFSTIVTAQLLMCGASVSSCGKSCPSGRDRTGTWATKTYVCCFIFLLMYHYLCSSVSLFFWFLFQTFSLFISCSLFWAAPFCPPLDLPQNPFTFVCDFKLFFSHPLPLSFLPLSIGRMGFYYEVRTSAFVKKKKIFK